MLTGLQERVWRILAALPEASGFALAGGAALIMTGIVDRISKDPDIFGKYPATVTGFAEAAVQALNSQGLTATLERREPTYVRLDVTNGADATLVDLASDVRQRPVVATPRGPRS